jgi:ABC-2 type transport system ATP-binding protein
LPDCRVGPDVTAIRAAGLSKSYGDVEALADMSLSVDGGELYGFLGANGAGKTTTIRILTGQLVPDAGEVEVLGVDPTTDPVEVRRRVGVLPEREAPPTFLSAREYLAFVGAVRGMDDEAVAARTATWADRLSFEPTLDTLCGDLSRGQQQKVMLAGAFVHEPAAAFIDEPLVNLDPVMQERVKSFFASYCDAGNALFVSTHHVEVAADLCDRVGVVREGELRVERTAAELTDGSELLADFGVEP